MFCRIIWLWNSLLVVFVNPK